MARFDFKKFSLSDEGCGMKISSDSVLLGAWFLPAVSAARTVVDAGAGSGLLSLMAAQTCPQATVAGVELDAGACRAAALNFAASPWKDRLELLPGDFCLLAQNISGVDAVISNPPYFSTGAGAPDRARAAARHQQSLNFENLLRLSAAMLTPQGHLGLISPAADEDSILFRAELAGLKLRRLCRVSTTSAKPPVRLLWDFSPADGPVQSSTLCLRGSDGAPTPEYAAVVADFYLRLK